MSKRIPGLPPRPRSLVCACGIEMPVGVRGRVPEACPRCRASQYYVAKVAKRGGILCGQRSLIYPVACVDCRGLFIARSGVAKWCPICRVARDKHKAREFKVKSPAKARRSQLAAQLRRHGLTIDGFDALLAEQGGVCAICGTDDPAPKSRLCVDHDHSCCPGAHSCGRCIRGLLCDTCNRTIAIDNLARLRAAVSYLESHMQYQP